MFDFTQIKTNVQCSSAAALPLPDLLEYAAALSLFTSAPPGGNPQDSAAGGQLEPPAWFPPFPSDTKMRKGRLNAEAPLGMAGESHTIGQREFLFSSYKSQHTNLFFTYQHHRRLHQARRMHYLLQGWSTAVTDVTFGTGLATTTGTRTPNRSTSTTSTSIQMMMIDILVSAALSYAACKDTYCTTITCHVQTHECCHNPGRSHAGS